MLKKPLTRSVFRWSFAMTVPSPWHLIAKHHCYLLFKEELIWALLLLFPPWPLVWSKPSNGGMSDFSFTQYNETLLLKLDPACFKKIALLQLRRCLMAPLIPRLISRLGNRAASVELAHSEPGNGNYCICLHLPPGAAGYGLMDAELGDGPDPRCAIRPVALCHFSRITWVLGSGLRVTDSLPHANE